ncbi:MAG: response regulator [Rubrimonas sp.]|uniref:response regulator n=1 Tax=Rubrimonas sp. TaxID=2036015 RepID=UPI002FDCCE6F
MDGTEAQCRCGAQGATVRPLDGRRVLIVEDSPAFQGALAAMARALGGAETIVGTGEAGLREFARGGYDLAIVDIDLPDMSGAEVIAQVRGGAAALLAVSAHAEPQDAPDADHFEAKPIARLADFESAVRRALEGRDARREG